MLRDLGQLAITLKAALAVFGALTAMAGIGLWLGHTVKNWRNPPSDTDLAYLLAGVAALLWVLK